MEKVPYVFCPKCAGDLSQIVGDKTGYYYCTKCEKWFSPMEVGT